MIVVDFKAITDRVIPFLNQNPSIGIKLYDFMDGCKIHSLMINRYHLTVEGINSIPLRGIPLGFPKRESRKGLER